MNLPDSASPRPLRIAQVSSFYAPARIGGAEVFIEALAQELAARGHSLEVFCTGEREVDEEMDGIGVHRRRNRNLYWPPTAGAPSAVRRTAWQLRDLHNPAAAAAAVRALVRFEPDLVHLHQVGGLSSALYGALRRELPGVPVVQTLHDFWHACVRQTLLHDGRICTRRCAPCVARGMVTLRAARSVDRFVSPSHFLAEWYGTRGLLAAHRFEVIPCGIRVPVAPAEVRAHRAARRPGRVRALFLGQLVPHKGIRTLLEAARRAGAASVEITIAGAGPLEAEVRAAPDVRFVGRLAGEEKRRALLEADVLVVPSEWYENLPISVLEGLHHGLAIVASGMGGLPELVAPGENGLLVPPADPDALADALARVSSGEEALLGWQRASLERASGFTIEHSAERYLSLYRALGAGRSRG